MTRKEVIVRATRGSSRGFKPPISSASPRGSSAGSRAATSAAGTMGSRTSAAGRRGAAAFASRPSIASAGPRGSVCRLLDPALLGARHRAARLPAVVHVDAPGAAGRGARPEGAGARQVSPQAGAAADGRHARAPRRLDACVAGGPRTTWWWPRRRRWPHPLRALLAQEGPPRPSPRWPTSHHHGRFAELYTDRGSHFCRTDGRAAPDLAYDTQVQRALKALGIRHILARSPKPAAAASAPSGPSRAASPRSCASPESPTTRPPIPTSRRPSCRTSIAASPSSRRSPAAFVPLAGVDLRLVLSAQPRARRPQRQHRHLRAALPPTPPDAAPALRPLSRPRPRVPR